MPYFDRVLDLSTSTGTGNMALAGTPPTGYVTFASVFNDSDQITYCIFDPNTGNWETGYGNTTGFGASLVRNRVSESTNANALVNFAAGTKFVYCAQIAQEFESAGQSTAYNMNLGMS